MTKKIVFILLILSGILNAEIPPGYYENGDDFKGGK